MAIFGFGKDKEQEVAPAKKARTPEPVMPAKSSTTVSGNTGGFERVLRNPRITEKATAQAAVNAYVFDVAEDATKRSVADAIHSVYQVRPSSVRIVPVPQKVKRSMRTGRTGTRGGGKKAYVYLRKGDTITIT